MRNILFDYTEDDIQKKSKTIKNELLHNIINENENCLLLLDPTLRNINPENPLWDALKGKEVQIVKFSHTELYDVFELFLIPLNLNNSSDIELFNLSIDATLHEISPKHLDAGAGRSVYGWLITPHSCDYVARHLSSTAIQTISGEGEFLLRFFDPSIINITLSVLDNWQQSRLLGSVQRWYYIDGDAQIINQEGYYNHQRQMDFSLSIDNNTWRKIQHLSVINDIMRCYRNEYQFEERVNELLAHRWLLVALESMSYAKFLENRDDCRLFGIHILTKHPLIYQSRRLQEMIDSSVHMKDTSYRLLVKNFSIQDWEQIIKECKRSVQ
ncbi:DUF4123 domain-containing protein [Rahnella bruchi]|uniref:DUF4123 domain-containing protein n=1 Tax=Rahnella bruchi TaxID=1510573 RepID=UPI0013C4124B|nr:DUF4123 domain-containing protein [Rahnella bruchi]